MKTLRSLTDLMPVADRLLISALLILLCLASLLVLTHA